MKKIITSLMVCMSLCTVVFAQNASDFAVNDDGVITKYHGFDTDVVIPATIGGKRITAIGREAFQKADLTSVTIPNSVTSIIQYEKFSELRKLEIDSVNTAPKFPFIFTQDGKGIIGFDSKSESNYIRIWNVETGKVERNIRVFSSSGSHNVRPGYIAISPDGTKLITDSYYTAKGNVLLWDIASGAYRECTGHTKQINALAFSPDGKYFVSASGDKTIKKWSAETGQEIQSIECDLGNDAVFSPDLRQIVTADSNRNIRILDVTNGKTIRTISGIGYKLTYSPDGSRIVAFDERGRIRIIDAQSGRELFTLTGHESSNNVNYAIVPSRITVYKSRQ